MQTDILSAHLNSTGFCVLGRYRLKSFAFTASATAGTINFYDTNVAPVTGGTYGRSSNTITVSSTSHGLVVGQQIGITFAAASGVSATNGNYTIVTVADANTFTVTDINSGTIVAGTGCTYTTGRWMTSIDTAALTTSGVPQNMNVLLPGEGIMAYKGGIYALMSNQTGLTIFYG
jgi:hypothetical protein